MWLHNTPMCIHTFTKILIWFMEATYHEKKKKKEPPPKKITEKKKSEKKETEKKFKKPDPEKTEKKILQLKRIVPKLNFPK